MEAGLSLARQARSKHRYELHTLTYVTLDQANGGIVRNLNHEGIGVQVVAAVRPGQQLRVRFELRQPRLRVEARGEVTWSTLGGQCGIRFIDMSPRTTRQINEWIFGSLLEGIALRAEGTGMFGEASAAMWNPGAVMEPDAVIEDDGLIISAAPLKIIELPARGYSRAHVGEETAPSEFEWLFQPLTGRSLIWTINTLVMMAALLLFVLVFLTITGEPPRWPLAMGCGAAVLVAGLYWGFFEVFGGASPGARLARLAGCDVDDDEKTRVARFR
jgi:hypothetical protein